MPEALVISGLSHAYGATPVLDGVDLSVQEGQLVALLGASGCGKTTLLRAVAGLLTPSAGDIHVGGRVVVEGGREQVRCEGRAVGLVFQDYALFPTLSVRDNVGFGVRDTARVSRLLDVTGLGELADRRPAQLSGGQQQRVALARALAPRPALILLDEPFANVDAQRRLSLGRFLRDVLAAEGCAAMLVTHDQDAALRLGDHVAVLVPGERGATVAQVGTPEEVYRNPVSTEVACLTGPAFVVEGDIVRPEQLQFTPGEGDAVVVATAFRGRCWSLLVECSAGELEVESQGTQTPGTQGSLGRREGR